MSHKKMNANGGIDRRKRMMSLEMKHEIIEKHEQGVRCVDLARQYERNTSTICTILKQKESIKAINPAKGITIISKLRTSVHEQMERLLLVWLTDRELAGDIVTEAVICKKARTIYDDLIKLTTGTSTVDAPEELFKASRGWFYNFQKRTGIYSDVRHDEAANSDVKAAEAFVLHEQVRTGVLHEIHREETEAKEVGDIKEVLAMWVKFSHFIEKRHPEKIATARALALCNDTCLTHFRNILKGRKKQTSLDRLILKRPASENEECLPKKERVSDDEEENE